jgi:hypothetical protein
MADDNLDKELFKNLRIEIRKRWLDQWIEATWKDRAFSEYTSEADLAKIAVKGGTVQTATDNGLVVPDDTIVRLQSQVTLQSTPKSVEPLMREAINNSDAMDDHLG